MVLVLAQMPANILGIYGASRNVLGERQRYLHPDAAASIMKLEGTGLRLRFSDMLRSALESLEAMQKKRGVQKPGYSGHNYGFAIDIDVDDCMKRFKLDKTRLDNLLESYGWYCHRKDHKIGPDSNEHWHYNYFGKGTEADEILAHCGATSTSGGLEFKIQKMYGSQFTLSTDQVIKALEDLGYSSLSHFQQKLLLPATGTADGVTARTLAFCAAERSIQPITAAA